MPHRPARPPRGSASPLCGRSRSPARAAPRRRSPLRCAAPPCSGPRGRRRARSDVSSSSSRVFAVELLGGEAEGWSRASSSARPTSGAGSSRPATGAGRRRRRQPTRRPRVDSRPRTPTGARRGDARRPRAARTTETVVRAESLWRGSASRPARSSSRSPSRARIWAGESALARAAASSTANGSESSLAQGSADLLARLESRPGREQRDRLALGQRRHGNLDLALHPEKLAARDEEREAGTGREQRRELRRRARRPARNCPPRPTVAVGRCARRDRHGRRAPPRARRARAPDRAAPRAPPRTRLPRTPATSTRAASIARRVFPDPPGPVSVSRRAPAATRARTSASSRSRPTNELGGSGRFVLETRHERREIARSPTWRIRTVPSTSFRRCSPSSTS